MMSGQCVAVVSCNGTNTSTSSTSPEIIIRGILNNDKLSSTPSISDFYSTYTWIISNKYYDAKVDLCHVQQKNMIGQEFSEQVEAVIAIFNSEKEAKSIPNLESWLSYFDIWEPEIKLAVCQRCASVDDKESVHMNREEVLSWCLDNGFELVELDPILEDYDEDEDFGIVRIRQALSAHMWPHMQMKKNSLNSKSSLVEKDENALEATPSKTSEKVPFSEESETKSEAQTTSAASIEERINSLLPSEEFGDDAENNFESLFQKMQLFKETAATKSGSSRMDYAEQVVTAFWRAIGGDEDELRGSSSDDG